VSRTRPGSNGASEGAGSAHGAEPLELLHLLPGRLRVYSAALRADPERAAALQAELRARPGVRSARVNPLTGTALVFFEPAPDEPLSEALQRLLPGADPTELERRAARCAEQLAAAAQRRQPPPRAQRTDWGERILASMRRLDEAVARNTGGADFEVLLPGILALLGAYRMSTERLAAPRWYEFFWFAFNAFVTLHRERRR
jgi:hypothetical protein